MSLWRRLGTAAQVAVVMARALPPSDALIWTSRLGERGETEALRHAVLEGRRIRPMGFRASLATGPAAAVAIDQGLTGAVEALDVGAALALLRVRQLLRRYPRVLLLGGEMAHESSPLASCGFAGLLLGRGEGLSIEPSADAPAKLPYPTAGLVQLAQAFLAGQRSTLVEQSGGLRWSLRLESS
jgi:hypothetical protein